MQRSSLDAFLITRNRVYNRSTTVMNARTGNAMTRANTWPPLDVDSSAGLKPSAIVVVGERRSALPSVYEQKSVVVGSKRFGSTAKWQRIRPSGAAAIEPGYICGDLGSLLEMGFPLPLCASPISRVERLGSVRAQYGCRSLLTVVTTRPVCSG
jgi:hypothetical protein